MPRSPKTATPDAPAPFVHPYVTAAQERVAELESALARLVEAEGEMNFEDAAVLLDAEPVFLNRSVQRLYGLRTPPARMDAADVAAILGRMKAGASPLRAYNEFADAYARTRRSNP